MDDCNRIVHGEVMSERDSARAWAQRWKALARVHRIAYQILPERTRKLKEARHLLRRLNDSFVGTQEQQSKIRIEVTEFLKGRND